MRRAAASGVPAFGPRCRRCMNLWGLRAHARLPPQPSVSSRLRTVRTLVLCTLSAAQVRDVADGTRAVSAVRPKCSQDRCSRRAVSHRKACYNLPKRTRCTHCRPYNLAPKTGHPRAQTCDSLQHGRNCVAVQVRRRRARRPPNQCVRQALLRDPLPHAPRVGRTQRRTGTQECHQRPLSPRTPCARAAASRRRAQ